MDNRQIESALREIIGTIKQKSASQDGATMQDVLLRYGDAHGLAPAQLEKLGTTLNNSLALAHAKQAQDRGESFDTVDVPVLLERYQDPCRTSQPKTKKASEKATIGPELSGSSVGSHFVQHIAPEWVKQEPEEKQAGTQVFDSVNPFPSCASLSPYEQRAETEGLQEVADHYLKLACAQLDQVVEVMRVKRASYQEIVHDVEAHLKEAAADTLEMLDRRMRRQGYEPEKVQAPDKRDYVTDRHGIVPAMKAAAENLEMRFAGLDLMAKTAARARKSPSSFDDVDVQAAQNQSPEPELEDEEEEKEPGGDPKKERLAQPVSRKYFSTRPTPADAPDLSFEAPKHERDDRSAFMAALLGGDSALRGLSQGARDVMDAGSPSRAAETARSTADNYSTLFGRDRENARDSITSAVHKWQQAATLRRLMLTDDVLSRSDPTQVVAAFDTLRKHNPALARDINVARIMLREAVQYQGVPLQTVETLQKLNRPDQAAVPGQRPAK